MVHLLYSPRDVEYYTLMANLETSCGVLLILVSKALKDLLFVLIVFIRAENMSCIDVR